MAERPRKLAGRLRGALATLALGLCLAAWLAPPGDGRPTARGRQATNVPLGGVNVVGLYSGVPPAQADSEIAAARRLHAKVVRAEIPWSALEPLGAGQIDARALAFTDRLVNDAAAAGIRVIMFVDSTPCWASSAPPSLLGRCAPDQSSAANAWPPVNPADFATFAAYLAQRYGPRLAALEIWNEPDQISQQYLAGPEKPQRYAAILRAAYTAIKQADPRVPVLGGSLVGSNGAFLRELYAAGIKGYYDGLAVHFYNLPLAALRAFHEVQLANGDTRPLWLDEFGWDSCYPRHLVHEEQACVTPSIQARNLADIVRSLTRAPYVAADVVYDLRNSDSEEFGMLTAGGARKPAFAALSGALTSPFGGASRVTLALGDRAGHVLASGSAPVGDYMELEAFQGSVLRYRALFTLDRFDRYAITLPRVLGTHGLRVRVYQYWAGPARGTQRSI